MTVLDRFKSLTVENFRGLLTTQRAQDCPLDFAPIANNCSYLGGKVGSRDGTFTFINLGAGTDIYHAEFLFFNTVRYFLFLMQDNKLYYSTESGGRTLLIDPGGSPTHFKIAVYGNLVFLFFSKAGSIYGVSGPFVWDPTKLPTVQVDLCTIAPEPSITTKATGTLTCDGTVPSDGDTVTLQADFFANFQNVSFVYTFKSSLTGTTGSAGEVLIGTGGSAVADTMANLKAAINLDPSGLGVTYGRGTTDPFVLFEATTLGATTLVVSARQSGVSQNGLKTTVSSTHLSWGSGTLGGGGKLDGASGATGDCNGGYHAVRVIFKTRSGYYTSPSDVRVNLVLGPGSTLLMSGIPVYTGATGHAAAECTGRVLIMTEAFGDDALLASMLDRINWNDALNGTYYTALEINDNSTTTGTINIADEQLREETNWTDAFQFTSPLPMFSIGKLYHERLIASGDSSNASLQYISEIGSPQTFRADIGFRDINHDDGMAVVTSYKIRDMLYSVKSLGIYALSDNGSTPDTWPLMIITQQVGTNSISGVSESSDEDFVVILDFRGMYWTNGSPPEKMSKGIQPTWDTLHIANLDTAEIHIDSRKRRIHCLVPTGSATQPDKDFVCDYQDGWGDRAKWSIHYPQTRKWRSMMVDTGGYRMLVCLDSALVQKFDDTAITDNGIAIDFQYRMGLAQVQQVGIGLFAGIDLHVTGTGNLGLKVYGPDGTLLLTPNVLAMTSAPEKDLFRAWNLRRERVFAEFFHNATNAASAIDRVTIFVTPDGIRSH